MNPKDTFTFLNMGEEPFFDLLDHVMNLVTRSKFNFEGAVPEGLSFTITNEVMDVDSEYRRLRDLFDKDGQFKDASARSQFIEELRIYVTSPEIVAAWKGFNKLLTKEEIAQVQQAAEQ
ncbi:MAG: hypothetical protein JWM80_3298 [Cyanobacteria bacterium RYN_339]|nr:hypothetical protein [Cyanobacteria bacterium RYN_339]